VRGTLESHEWTGRIKAATALYPSWERGNVPAHTIPAWCHTLIIEAHREALAYQAEIIEGKDKPKGGKSFKLPKSKQTKWFQEWRGRKAYG